VAVEEERSGDFGWPNGDVDVVSPPAALRKEGRTTLEQEVSGMGSRAEESGLPLFEPRECLRRLLKLEGTAEDQD
jgi:hypothetical protein